MFSVENINVNVAKLIDDQDYDEVVDQVYDRLEESISRRSPVGGIRMRYLTENVAAGESFCFTSS